HFQGLDHPSEANIQAWRDASNRSPRARGPIPVLRGARRARAAPSAGRGRGRARLCPSPRARSIDDLSGAATERRDARREARVPSGRGAVEGRTPGATSEAVTLTMMEVYG